MKNIVENSIDNFTKIDTTKLDHLKGGISFYGSVLSLIENHELFSKK